MASEWASLLPYGEHQGSFRGVVACSNRDDGYFSGESNYVNSLICTGFRYQCVEYARRFLLLTTGCVFDSCGRASEIYAMDHITHVETGTRYNLLHHHNDGTATQRPEPGDIIIYPYHPQLTPWGHVGIISFVDDHHVGIAEQNHYFGLFTSPSELYLDGERCVARYATLQYDEAAKTWRIEEPGSMPRALGWMSYPDAPTRDHIHAPFSPLPSAVKLSSTPFDHEDHPFLTHYHLRSSFDIPCGPVEHAYGMRSGAAETLVAATSAIARVLRFTLQLLFHRSRLGFAFRALPTNPLNATLPNGADGGTEACGDLDALFKVLASEEVVCATEATPDVLRQALGSYFDIPLEWVVAMERDFAKGGAHLAAVASFYPNIATNLVDVEVFRAARKKAAAGAVSAVQPMSATAAGTGNHAAEEPVTATSRGTVEEFPVENPHDESWRLVKVGFGNALIMAELSQLDTVKRELEEAIALMTPSMRSYMSTRYCTDFAGYLNSVENLYGHRTALTIVVSDGPPTDSLVREFITIVQNLCSGVEYPVRVVHERDLSFANGKLHAAPREVWREVDSPPPSITPSGVYEVDFVYALCEWPEILGNGGANHVALYRAAVDPASDVVFAKPLWSYLCSGRVHDGGGAKGAHETHSARFFDVCRRLYLLASPKQPPEAWDLEVAEYKDSCRRIHIDAETMPVRSPVHLSAHSVMINLAWSCHMGRVGCGLNSDPENPCADPGHPAPLFFMHSED
ncbi:hypothetical protein LSCM1_00462 [Leishmania martiniquensis]|uniref:Peptidase C51 domain-containing protein n=1 Tax=Leishmania martiniquensis TaxID=1580590 RepID=A0A836FYR4_9TRYP|nr:hypothetical protein LSCM1_00462 [Leishmania martiniquensis]